MSALAELGVLNGLTAKKLGELSGGGRRPMHCGDTPAWIPCMAARILCMAPTMAQGISYPLAATSPYATGTTTFRWGGWGRGREGWAASWATARDKVLSGPALIWPCAEATSHVFEGLVNLSEIIPTTKHPAWIRSFLDATSAWRRSRPRPPAWIGSRPCPRCRACLRAQRATSWSRGPSTTTACTPWDRAGPHMTRMTPR